MISNFGSPAVLGPEWRSHVAEEARTRGFASLTLIRFAFSDVTLIKYTSVDARQLGTIRILESFQAAEPDQSHFGGVSVDQPHLRKGPRSRHARITKLHHRVESPTRRLERARTEALPDVSIRSLDEISHRRLVGFLPGP